MTTTSPVCQLPVSATETVNEVVVRLPQAWPVLRQFGIDTCCGGALPLATVAAHHGHDVDVLLAALNEATRNPQ